MMRDNDDHTVPLGPVSQTGTEPASAIEDAPDDPPERLGRYLVVGELGRGGMGTVLRAYDPKLGREVALKRLRRQDEETEARLVREAQAMARLTHPNVVSVYDVDVGQNEATIAMELVQGPSLKQWLRDDARTWAQIVALFREAGQGLAAAHQAGLVHRDFKPANVLVTEDGHAKVTDFGLAKATDLADEPSMGSQVSHDVGDLPSTGRSTSLEDPLTEAGVVLGTPRYMAPEQYVGGRADHHSDQYGFCVALWEALCGSAPFTGKYRQAFERKLEGPPAWPKGSKVPPAVVETITRGLQVDRWQRWPTMEPLLEALAYDPQAHRRRVTWMVGVGVVVGALSLAGVQWWSARAARCQGAPAKVQTAWSDDHREAMSAAFTATGTLFGPTALQRTSATLDAWGEDWANEHQRACEATAIRGEQSQAMLDLRMACLRRSLVQAGAIVDVLTDANTDTVAKAEDIVASLPDPSRCADVEALQLEDRDAVPAKAREHVDRIEAQLAAGRAQTTAARFDQAAQVLEPLLDEARALGHEPTTARVALALGILEGHRGRDDEAEARLRESLRLALHQASPNAAAKAARQLIAIVGSHQARYDEADWLSALAVELSARPDADPALATRVETTLVSLAIARGDAKEAERWIRRVLEQVESTEDPSGGPVLSARVMLGEVLLAQGRLDEARAEFEWTHAQRVATYGEDHPVVATALASLAHVALRQGEHDRAEQLSREVLQLRVRLLGPRHPETGRAHLNLGTILKVRGGLGEAETELLAGLDVLHAHYGDRHPDVGGATSSLGRLYMAQERLDEAQPMLERSLRIFEQTQGEGSTNVGRVLGSLADVHYDRAQYAEAEALQRRALTLYIEQLDPEHPFVGANTFNLARSINLQGRTREAEPLLREALRIYETRVSPEHPDLIMLLRTLGQVLLAHEQADEAVEVLERALAIEQGVEGMEAAGARARLALARALAKSGGDMKRARSLAEQARAFFSGKDDELAAKARAWLARHPAR